MTQFLLSVHHREGDAMPSTEEMQQMYASVDAFNQKLQSTGAWVVAGGLTDVSQAKVVDASAGAGAVTDGPFSEAREWLGGLPRTGRGAGPAGRMTGRPVHFVP